MNRASKILVACLALGAAGAAVFLLYPRTRLPTDLLDGVPEEVSGLAHLRPARMLTSKAFDQLVSQRGHDAGMKEVERLCGENPVAQVDEAVVFALHKQGVHKPDVGALLRGDLDPRALADCVKRSLESQGKVSRLAQDDIDGVPCVVSSKGDSRACALWDGLIVGTDAGVRAALATVKGERTSVRRNGELASLWETLDPDADVRVVGRVPESTRKLMRLFALPFLPRALLPLTRVSGGAGELFLRGDSVRGEAALDTDSAEDAETLVTAAQDVLQRMGGSAAVALTPAATLVEKTEVVATGSRVRLKGDYPLHALGTVLDMLPAAQQALTPRAAPAPAQPPSAP